MRLYLSSFRVGAAPEAFVGLAGSGSRVAVVANAMDMLPADERGERVRFEVDCLAELGFDPSEVDLRDVDGAATARELLAGYAALWVRGGNVFVLRQALATSGVDAVLPALLADDVVVYAGYSAGACVLAPSLHGLEACDDVDDVRRVHGVEPRFDGLGVLPYAIVPHLGTPEHPENSVLEQVAQRYRDDGTTFRGLRDGEALVLDGSVVKVAGDR